MTSKTDGSTPQVGMTMAVIFLVLAATAIPIEFRGICKARVDSSFDDVSDITANIIGFLPMGMIFVNSGLAKAILIPGLVSAFAETSQLAFMHRNPSFVDFLCNVVGAALGFGLSSRYGIRLDTLGITRSKAVIAALLALGIIIGVRRQAGDPVSVRGVTSPGTLEAYWKLNDTAGRSVSDLSGHHLAGSFRNEPQRINDETGVAPVFDGQNYIDLGHATALRLAGSMTISARIRSNLSPFDDAAIVSQRQGNFGYQLDTTIDNGPRTVGFKLTDACGNMMARYGSTAISLNTWYHVAGVYDAARQTLDVYLNGELDDGSLAGSITRSQRTSRGPVYIGRRAGSNLFNFSGSIKNVRIYSFALTKSQIAADMRDEPVQDPEAHDVASVQASTFGEPSSDEDDKELPVAAATLGVLVAVAVLGMWPTARRLRLLGASFAAGLLLLSVTTPGLPAFNKWTLPLTSLGGGVCIAASVRLKYGPNDELAGI